MWHIYGMRIDDGVSPSVSLEHLSGMFMLMLMFMCSGCRTLRLCDIAVLNSALFIENKTMKLMSQRSLQSPGPEPSLEQAKRRQGQEKNKRKTRETLSRTLACVCVCVCVCLGVEWGV